MIKQNQFSLGSEVFFTAVANALFPCLSKEIKSHPQGWLRNQLLTYIPPDLLPLGSAGSAVVIGSIGVSPVETPMSEVSSIVSRAENACDLDQRVYFSSSTFRLRASFSFSWSLYDISLAAPVSIMKANPVFWLATRAGEMGPSCPLRISLFSPAQERKFLRLGDAVAKGGRIQSK